MADGAQPSPEARPDKSHEDTRRDRPVERLNGASFIHEVVLAGILVALVTAASLLLEPLTGYLSIALLYLLLIVAAALKLGRVPVLMLAAVSALLWNFLFIPPHFTFYIDRLGDAMMFATFFVVAMAMGHLTSRLRSSEMAERRRERRTAALYELAHQAAFATDLKNGLSAAVSLIASVSGAQAALLLRREDHTLSLLAHTTSSFAPSEKEKSAALWTFHHPLPADKSGGARSDSEALCLPLQGRTAVMGVLCIRRSSEKSFDPDESELLEAFAVLIGLILEKDHVVEAVKRAEILEASERLRRTLLDSVSHELKTPLSAVQAGIDALGRQLGSDEEKHATLREVQSAVRRLRRVIDNLLTMTRIEAGVIQPKLDWCDVAELVESAVDLAGEGIVEHEIVIETGHDLPMMRLDQALIEQCLCNLLLNAASWSGPGKTITVRAALEGARLALAVLDEGPGVKKTDLRRIFEKFYRASDAPPGGTGLGLAIVDNFVRSHGGSARAANREMGGAEFTLTIPVETMRTGAMEELS